MLGTPHGLTYRSEIASFFGESSNLVISLQGQRISTDHPSRTDDRPLYPAGWRPWSTEGPPPVYESIESDAAGV